MSIRVDSAVLESESHTLATLAGDIESLAPSIPSGYDGGDATALIATVLATYTRAGSVLACGLAALADAVAASSTRYREQDLDSADALNAAQWEGTR